MPDVTDMELVREYCARQSEPAFEMLVHRHVNLVYSTALRQVGNRAQAEEITQAVFVILARKAARLQPDAVLAAWLHETARHVAASFLRGEIRRRRREQEAYMQSTLQPSSDESVWEQLAPLLDEAIGRLRTGDRNVVALRYFQNKSAHEIAAALNIGEDAAKKRLARAVEKLRLDFYKRGINVSADALSGAVLTHSVEAAPAALAKTATAVALAKGATASTSTLTLIKGALKIMAWTKLKTAIGIGAAIVLATGTTTLVVHHQQRTLPKPQPVISGQTEFPRASWRFAGYADPESALQSLVWALGKGDGRTFRNSVSPTLQREYAPKPDNAVITAQNKADVARIMGYRILDKQVLSEDEVVLNCYAEGLNDTQKFSIKRVGNEWKFDSNPKK